MKYPMSIVALIGFLWMSLAFNRMGGVSMSLDRTVSMSSGKSCLIIQNKGGGHGSIGYHLSKAILSSSPNCKVSILQDQASDKKEPFKSYPLIEALGVSIVQGKLLPKENEISIPANIVGQQYDFIVDNWSKTPEMAKAVCDLAVSSKTKQLLFVSSAGMYQTSGLQPIVETDPVKSGNGARKVEEVIEKSGVPYTFLRPQYLYGEKASKSYLDFFIGRIHRNFPVPVPLSGDQLVCLTNLEDLASLISTCIGNEKSMNEIFNVGTDRYISYKGICSAIGASLGKDKNSIQVLSYDPSLFGHWDGSLDVSEFPFRPQTFVTSVDKAKNVLKWSPKRDIIHDLKVRMIG
jgi:nucleoside-diphosphate-sugar epimerase